MEKIDPGTPAADDEVIILYNNGTAAVDISKWSLQVRGLTATTMQKKNMVTGASVPAGGRYTIANKNGRYALQANTTYSSLSLPESGATVAMVSSTATITGFDDILVAAKFTYTADTASEDAPPATTKSVASVPDKIAIPTSAEANKNIHLNELWPRPTSGDEFIELRNDGADAADVRGWRLRDASAVEYILGSRGEETMLMPHGFRIWPRKITAIALNDTDGEMVQLLNNSGEVMEQIIYAGDVMADASYSYLFNTWVWVALSTPGATNVWQEINVAPVARAEIPVAPIAAGTKFTVSAADTTDANNNLARLWWNFGDGWEMAATSTTYFYRDPGEYLVSLVASDLLGASARVERKILVTSSTAALGKLSATAFDDSVPIKIVAATSTKAPTKKTITKTTTPTAKSMTITVQIPLGLISVRRFAADNKIFELPTGTNFAFRAGDRVRLSAKPKISGTLTLWQVDKKTGWQKIGAADPRFTTTTGQVLDTLSNHWRLGTAQNDLVVMSKAKTYTEKLMVGDQVQIVGVIVTGNEPGDDSVLIPKDSHAISLVAGAKKNTKSSPAVSTTLGVVAAFAAALLGINILAARFLRTKTQNNS